jgi:hypothetical protein
MVSGCAKSGRRAGPEALPVGEVVYVRVAPLVSEHPLYGEVVELTRLLERPALADVRSATVLMASPIGRVLAAPRAPAPPSPARTAAWEAEADAELAQELGAVRELLASWPEPESSQDAVRRSRQLGTELRTASNDIQLRVVRAEAAAIERRKGELGELRFKAGSADAYEAARALERQAEIWRQIRAESATLRDQGERELRRKRVEMQQRLEEETREIRAAAKAGERQHTGDLEGSGAAVRSGQEAALAAAVRPVEPGEDLRSTPAAPQTDELTSLLREIDRERRADWERRTRRIEATRSVLLDRVARNTQNAIRSVAAQVGTTVLFDIPADHTIADATESFRIPLRRYWATGPQTVADERAARGR